MEMDKQQAEKYIAHAYMRSDNAIKLGAFIKLMNALDNESTRDRAIHIIEIIKAKKSRKKLL